MKWYQVDEQAAGAKRLFLLYQIHRIFGRNAVKFLIYFITFFAFCAAGKIRKCSKKYLSIIGINPILLNQYRHFLEYSLSLLDKMEVYAGTFDVNKIIFAKTEELETLKKDFNSGIFFICSHLGNIDVMRALLKKHPEKQVRVFLAQEQCKIFNDFLKKISVPTPIKAYPVEEIGIETSIETSESLQNGAFIFIAGDRTSRNAENFKTKLFNHNVEFPLGTFKFALIMDAPVYFVCAIKDKNENYNIHLKKFSFAGSKQETLSQIKKEYTQFLEEKTKLAPFQFFHFYDMFD